MPRCEANQCKRNVVGFAWMRLIDGTWKHNLLRECFRCRDRTCDLIHYVQADVPMCSWCFGQDIELEVGLEKSISRCTRCGRTDMWQLEVPGHFYHNEDGNEEEEEEEYGDDDELV